MKNFISINAKHYKKNEIKRIINHNVRLEEPTYLLDREHIKYKNVDIIYQNKRANAYDFQDPKSNNLKNLNLFLNKEQIAKALNEQYDLLINTKESIQKARKSYTKKNEATLVEFVVAISHEQTKEYLDNKVDITKGFNKIVDNLQKKYGFTPLHLSLHLDEGHIDIDTNEVKHNYHAHLTMVNFCFEKEKVVLRTLKKQDFSMLQDLAQDSFQEVGLDYKRGLNKNLTGNEHLERNMFISKKLNSKINSQHNLLKIQLEEITQNINLINELKNEHKELLKSYDKGSQEYQDLYEKIGGFQDLEKNLRKEQREIKENIKELENNELSLKNVVYELEDKIKTFNIDDKEELLRKLNNSINKIVANNTKTSTFGKVTYDTQKIIEDFKDLGKKLVNSNINIKNHEELVKNLEEVTLENKDLNKKLEDKDILINDLIYERNALKKEKEDTNQNTNNVLNQFKVSTSQKELEKDKILNQTNKMLSKANMKLKTMNNVLKDNGIKLNRENVAKAKGIETTKQKKLKEQEYKYSTIDR